MHSSQPRASERCGEYEVSDGWASKQISSESDSSDCSHQDRNVALATFFAGCKWAVNHFRWSTWLWNPFSNPLQVQMTQPLGEDENYIPVHRRDTHQSSIFGLGQCYGTPNTGFFWNWKILFPVLMASMNFHVKLQPWISSWPLFWRRRAQVRSTLHCWDLREAWWGCKAAGSSNWNSEIYFKKLG